MAEKIQKRKTMTPGALTANRANGTKGGRPSGREKIELRDRIRARETDIVEHLFHLAFHAQSGNSAGWEPASFWIVAGVVRSSL
jgi:hypothetical protein